MKQWMLTFFVMSLLSISALAQEELNEEIPSEQKVDKKEEVRFLKEELARETVLPVFRNKSVIKNRTVSLTGKIDVSLLVGKTLNDAFYDNVPLGAHVAYNFSETNALMFDFLSYSAGQNSFVNQVKNKVPSFNLSQVPLLQSAYSLNWQYTPYYGKMSFSKERVYNLSTYTVMGLGKLNYTNGSSTLLQFGVGQKLYFNSNWGVKLDLRAKFYKFPDFLNSVSPSPPYEEVSTYNLEMSVGAVYIF